MARSPPRRSPRGSVVIVKLREWCEDPRSSLPICATRRIGSGVTLVVDAGALIALDRGERSMWVLLKAAQSRGDVPVTHAGVLGQVWRGGPRPQIQTTYSLWP